jgi:predicted nucleic acid-binding protein
MNLVVDANILFADLIRKGITEDLILLRKFKLFAPRFLFEIFSKYRDYILRKTDRPEWEFNALLDILRKR